jgi:hypothetical protein
VIRSFGQHKRQKELARQGRNPPSSIFEAFCDVSDVEDDVEVDEEKGEEKPKGLGGSAETLKNEDKVKRDSFTSSASSIRSENSYKGAPSLIAPRKSREKKPTFMTSKERKPSPRRPSPHGSPRKSPSPQLGSGRRSTGKYLDVPGSKPRGGGALPSLFLRTQSQDIQVNDLGQSFRGTAISPGGINIMEMEGEVDESIAPSSNPLAVGISVMDWRLDGDVESEVLNLKIRVGDERTYRRLISTLAGFQ